MRPAGARTIPREYDSYKRMQDSSPATKTKYGGAAQRDYLEEAPATVVLFAGSTFDKDYRQARGHAHTIDDVTGTPRVKVEDARPPAGAQSREAGHVLDLQEPRRAADDEEDGRPEGVLRREVRRSQGRDHAPHRLLRLPRGQHA